MIDARVASGLHSTAMGDDESFPSRLPTAVHLPYFPLQSEFPCFEYMGDSALTGFKKRLMLGAKDSDVAKRARRMVNKASSHWGTRFYDKFQLWSNGILP